MLGIDLSGHPLENYMDEFERFNFNSSMLGSMEKDDSSEEDDDLPEESQGEVLIEDGMRVVCGGSLEGVKKVFTKATNKEMAIVTIEDVYGTFESMIPPKVYDRYREMLVEDSLIKITGKVSIRNGEDVSIVADKIEPLVHENNLVVEQPTMQAPRATHTLYLKYDTQNSLTHENILAVLKSYPGTTPVIVKCESLGRAFKLNFMINPRDYLLNERHALIDDENIKLI